MGENLAERGPLATNQHPEKNLINDVEYGCGWLYLKP